jgi:hypothetical protein
MVKNGPAHLGEFLSAVRGKFFNEGSINLQGILGYIQGDLEYCV